MRFPEEAETVSKLVLEAADEILSIYGTDFDVMEKSKGDPLTQADLRANEIIANGIRELLQDPVYSEEESTFSPKTKASRVWILDPIDGTREFVAKNPEFAISLGLVENGKLDFGIVMNPVTGEFFWGRAGIGSGYVILETPYKDRKINWDDRSKFLEDAKPEDPNQILVSVSETRDKLFQNIHYGERFVLKAKGSIAYKLALVAVGKFPMTLSLRPKNDWDVAGGIAILRASGGLDLEIKSGKEYPFLSSKLGIGLIAGKKEIVQEFWKEFQNSMQSSVRERW
ncbi:3'(2'),5'-bisphosphate nucleotidase CysQ [Leptospira langatensis]|uniref:3'(2'),5'-bisphosphate nucleotidase CysQ n=1 Tax=Leptospira langatensis TaxID=2484983 RepID=A0A5F1ZPS4_9LEPT|nr:3'(2'),5'-bisphosphate nucleotidase CysQ [Leptospira langatensis]TGK05575.1 3'(2'),5'-bisphosphate nucleotidase CysQ [Leptospira langatensis]TGL38707.1 3'(2'),5'-bisphosphate nucleotidase CysQ [Leptospira langatensis]